MWVLGPSQWRSASLPCGVGSEGRQPEWFEFSGSLPVSSLSCGFLSLKVRPVLLLLLANSLNQVLPVTVIYDQPSCPHLIPYKFKGNILLVVPVSRTVHRRQEVS